MTATIEKSREQSIPTQEEVHAAAKKVGDAESLGIVTDQVYFDAFGSSHYYFSTNKGNSPSSALMHASCLIAGVRNIIQTEADANGGISNSHYALLSILESAGALIDSVEVNLRC